MNSKIGIMTFNRSLNYGSAIQAWALSRAIRKMNKAEVEIIDYIPNHYEELYAVFFPPTSKKKIKDDLLHLLMLPFFLHRKRDFSKFWKTSLPLSRKTIDSKDDFAVFARNFNTIICGSDQIWNPRAIDFDMAYLLPGISGVKKIAYAVSIGDAGFEEAAEQQDFIRKCIEDFDYLSMREVSGALKLKEFLREKREVEVVLDPTLLHAKEEYKEITSKREVEGPYIFFYSVRMSREVIRDAIAIGKRLNMPVYTLISGIGKTGVIKERKGLKIGNKDTGPSGFLSFLYNAEFVVTDSFHGTALSIKFEKNFIAVNTRKGDGTLKNDARISHILGLLDLNNRYVTSKEIETFDLREEINYGAVSDHLNREIEKSFEYLKQALSD